MKMPLEINAAVQLLENQQGFTVGGRDKKGRQIVSIIGKNFPAKLVSVESVKKYLEAKVYPELDGQPFSVVYFHSEVEKSENFMGLSALRAIYDSIPIKIRDDLKAVYFVHPGFQARLYMATLGRFFFSGGLYGKLKYIIRVAYLWEHVNRREIEIPEIVYDRDEELDQFRTLDSYCIESDHPRTCRMNEIEFPVQMYYSTSSRCIS